MNRLSKSFGQVNCDWYKQIWKGPCSKRGLDMAIERSRDVKERLFVSDQD